MVVVGGCYLVLVFFVLIYNMVALFFGTLEMQRRFVLKDKLVCTMKKKRIVSMATVNIILEHGGVHAKLVMSPLLLILDH